MSLTITQAAQAARDTLFPGEAIHMRVDRSPVPRRPSAYLKGKALGMHQMLELTKPSGSWSDALKEALGDEFVLTIFPEDVEIYRRPLKVVGVLAALAEAKRLPVGRSLLVECPRVANFYTPDPRATDAMAAPALSVSRPATKDLLAGVLGPDYTVTESSKVGGYFLHIHHAGRTNEAERKAAYSPHSGYHSTTG